MVWRSLLEWNKWWKTEEVDKELLGYERDETNEITKLMKLRHIKILAGVRRSGKSTIMYQLIQRLINSGIKTKNILYLNFEDELVLGTELDKIIEVYYENMNPDKEIYIFLDEIQYKKRWEFWIKKQYDLRKFKQIIISGSSSSLLLSEYATLLTGRGISFIIYPLSFREFLKFHNIEIKNIKLLAGKEIAKIKHLLKIYFGYGGFPEVVLEKEKHRLLVGYYNDIIEKDIIGRHDVNREKIRKLVFYLNSNISGLHSFKKLGSVANLSANTVAEYMNYIEQSFLIFQMLIFSYKVKDQMQYPRKIYSIDPGLANANGFKFMENPGKIMENIVFNELKRRDKEVYYWKDRQSREIDFVVKEKAKIKELIQVCWNIDDKETKKREIGGLISAMKNLKVKNGIVITHDHESEEKFDNKKIEYVPSWKWLLRLSL